MSNKTIRCNFSLIGVIGALAANAYTFMGGIYSARRVQQELAPQLLDRLLAEHVNAVLFVPV